jgi:hypothetical protein
MKRYSLQVIALASLQPGFCSKLYSYEQFYQITAELILVIGISFKANEAAQRFAQRSFFVATGKFPDRDKNLQISRLSYYLLK